MAKRRASKGISDLDAGLLFKSVFRKKDAIAVFNTYLTFTPAQKAHVVYQIKAAKRGVIVK